MSDHRSYDERELQAMIHRALSRRQFLGRTAMAAGGLALGGSLLSACKGKEAGAGAEAPTATSVRISNWPLYIDEKVIPPWEKDTWRSAESWKFWH